MQGAPQIERPRQMAAGAPILFVPDIAMAGQDPK